ncbi:hypothetical protein V494_06166 [Pseudogymnoascus sp. VKM F-4513 (FW-928)]|nr:hypothetical protein V494_06166 [Pseudogymnoascus sp. VKM F-4513 (FW-928)]
MRFQELFLLAALPALSLAQSLDSLASEAPFCSLGPLSMAAGANDCNMDAKCLCSDKDFISSLTKKVEASCEQADTDKVVKLATDACKSAGVTVDIPVGESSDSSTDSSSTDSSTDQPGWGERSSRANLALVVGVVGLTAQAVL